jgi:hypothetical protein
MVKFKIHASCVALFLVFGHIAMISGMLDSAILGYQAPHAVGMNLDASDHHAGHYLLVELYIDIKGRYL